MRALLDIGVLLALLDGDHLQHQAGRQWFERELGHGWASCAITQNGFIRILSQPGYPSPVPPGKAMQLLALATSSGHHQYWPCDISMLDDTIFDRSRIHGPKQVTDAYLMGLAAHHGGRFVTFDRGIASTAVRTAGPENLVVL